MFWVMIYILLVRGDYTIGTVVEPGYNACLHAAEQISLQTHEPYSLDKVSCVRQTL